MRPKTLQGQTGGADRPRAAAFCGDVAQAGATEGRGVQGRRAARSTQRPYGVSVAGLRDVPGRSEERENPAQHVPDAGVAESGAKKVPVAALEKELDMRLQKATADNVLSCENLQQLLFLRLRHVTSVTNHRYLSITT